MTEKPFNNPFNSVHSVQKPIIRAEFSKNAALYDSVAVVQRRIANRVVEQAIYALQQVFNDPETVKHPIHILDAGCGTGYVGESFVNQLHQLATIERISEKSIHLTALDLSYEMLEAAKKRQIYRSFKEGDIEALPFSDSIFDLVVSSLAIQWCHHPQKAIAELVRVAQISEPHRSLHDASKRSPRIIISTLLEGTLQELSDAFQQIDNEQHILDFITETALRSIVQEYDGTLTVYKEVVTFDSLKSLFKSLKNIGASALPHRRKGLLGRESYQKLDHYFKMLGNYQLTYVVGLIEIP